MGDEWLLPKHQVVLSSSVITRPVKDDLAGCMFIVVRNKSVTGKNRAKVGSACSNCKDAHLRCDGTLPISHPPKHNLPSFPLKISGLLIFIRSLGRSFDAMILIEFSNPVYKRNRFLSGLLCFMLFPLVF
jgi:hypothetical protein